MGREKVIRVGIAQEGIQLSAVWRFWLHGSDVYVASRNIAHTIKTSLHKTGKFRHAFVTDAASEKFQSASADRAFSKWDRPAPQARGGTLLFQLLFPESELHPARHAEPMVSDVMWLPRPPAGHVTYVSVLELVPAASGLTPQFSDVVSSSALVSWPTPSGSTVWIMASVAPITAEQEREIVRLRAGLIERTAGMDLNDLAGEPRSHFRSFGIFDSRDAVGRIADIDAEFLRSRRIRIAERAYFLWENRAGERWWDAVSNWCQAERIESDSTA